MKPGRLILSNGTSFEGFLPEWQETTTTYGEVVFTTGMTGYVGTLTDPSYTGQIVTFTYPLIGNYGIPLKEDWESDKIHVQGVLVSEACLKWHHHAGKQSLLAWLQEYRVPILAGVDTRAITKLLRSSGSLLGTITSQESNLSPLFEDPNSTHLVAKVSTKEKRLYSHPQARKTIIAVDCGMKENQLRLLSEFPLNILRVPHHYDYTSESFDGIFLSNGPGDPATCSETIAILRKAMQFKKPIFGICLGNQLMARAVGANTYKLPFGHRGQNQPCIERETQRCFITSQNHGYAVDERSLPNDWKVSYHNLNDGSVEGIAHKTLPFFSVQFHPEAAPGPTDTTWLFKKFYELL